jgi:putative PIN family toxin of toxin-antitoxin system
MKVVIDTNVLMSGIFWTGAPNKLLKAWYQNAFNLVLSPPILEEYIRVNAILAERYEGVDASSVIELIAGRSEMYEPVELNESICDDPDDDKFVVCAISAGCSYIVSGDKHLLNVSGYSGIQVLKPASFVRYQLAY